MAKRKDPNQPVVKVIPVFPVPLRTPASLKEQIEGIRKWNELLFRADVLVSREIDMQQKAARKRNPMTIKERHVTPEVLGRFYSEYCTLINEMYHNYLYNMQVQKSEYMNEVICILLKRMYELREEIVHVLVNDYIFVDSALRQLFKTPYDIQILVPYHFGHCSRPDSIEDILRKMWKESARRKYKELHLKPNKEGSTKNDLNVYADDSQAEILVKGKGSGERVVEEEAKEEIEEEEESLIEEEEEIDPDAKSPEFIRTILIQRMERWRLYLKRVAKYKNRGLAIVVPKVEDDEPVKEKKKTHVHRSEKKKETNVIKIAPNALLFKAVGMIQRCYRCFMNAKREQIRQHRRNISLGLLPDTDHRPLKLRTETDKLLEMKYRKKNKIAEAFQKAIAKENARFVLMKKDEKMFEDITAGILEWFKEWYYGFNVFPQYPFPDEGGTLLLIRGAYPTMEEQDEIDEKFRRRTMGKTKEMLADEKKQAKQEALEKAKIAKEKLQKEEEAYQKARGNPKGDPGYQLKQSVNNDAIRDALNRYRSAWTFLEDYPLEFYSDVVYGFMQSLMRETLLETMDVNVRKVVDQMMRLELKLLNKALKFDYEKIGWRHKVHEPRQRPKKPPVIKPFIPDKNMYKSIEPIFDLGIISKPTSTLDDVLGDLNLAAYDMLVRDPYPTFPSPAYGDVKRRLVLSCIFASGIEPSAVRKKAVMLIGIKNNGKTFLADCCAGELGAVKFDISPEVFSSKAKKAARMLSKVFIAARIFQPSVIFLKNIERVFATITQLSHTDKALKPTIILKPLKKQIAGLLPTDKVIFIATCSDPSIAKMKPMFKLFSEVILVPAPDYGTLQNYLYNRLQSVRSIPRGMNVQPLAQVMRRIGLTTVMSVVDNVLNPSRIVGLAVKALDQMEFMEYMIENNIDQIPRNEYDKYLETIDKYSPLKKEREQYAVINKKRAQYYEMVALQEEKKRAK